MNKIFATVEQLSQDNAEEIANQWHYEGIYSFYNMGEDPEDYAEIISPKGRGDHYFQVLNDNNELTAFFCIEPIDEDSAEVGLGIKPELTGNGYGIELMKLIEEYLKEKTNFTDILLSVVDFNRRALKVYKRAGFSEIGVEDQESNGSIYKFVILKKVI